MLLARSLVGRRCCCFVFFEYSFTTASFGETFRCDRQCAFDLEDRFPVLDVCFTIEALMLLFVDLSNKKLKDVVQKRQRRV